MHGGKGGGRGGGGEEDQLEVSRALAMGQEVVLVKANFCLYFPVGSGEEGLEVGQVIPLICGLARLVGAVVLEQGLLIATQKEQLLWLPEEGRSFWLLAKKVSIGPQNYIFM